MSPVLFHWADIIRETPPCGFANSFLGLKSVGQCSTVLLRLAQKRLLHNHGSVNILLHLYMEPQHQGGVASSPRPSPLPADVLPTRRPCPTIDQLSRLHLTVLPAQWPSTLAADIRLSGPSDLYLPFCLPMVLQQAMPWVSITIGILDDKPCRKHYYHHLRTSTTGPRAYCRTSIRAGHLHTKHYNLETSKHGITKQTWPLNTTHQFFLTTQQ